MQLEDIEVDSKKKTSPDKEKRRDSLTVDGGNKSEQRRGSSHLLAAAGIGYESRRKLSHSQQGDTRFFQEGNDILMEGKDGKVHKLQIVEVTEKMGTFRKAVPTLPLCLAIFLCLINLFLPGIGTLIGAGSLVCCGKSHYPDKSTGIKYGIFAGIIQLLTAVVLVGWIWSIIYGVNMVQDAITRTSVSPQNPSEESTNRPPSDAKQSQAWA